jgi:transposase IS116/IS110/IS902 family protein
MTRFPTAGHLASWARFAPVDRSSAGKAKPGSTGKGNPWLAAILGEIVTAAARTGTFLDERYHRADDIPISLRSPLTWPRRSAGGRAPRSSPSTTGSPPSTRIRQRLPTLLQPMKPSCRSDSVSAQFGTRRSPDRSFSSGQQLASFRVQNDVRGRHVVFEVIHRGRAGDQEYLWP